MREVEVATAVQIDMASTIFLHVGQCGNQIGSFFWEEMIKSDDISTRSFTKFNEHSLSSVPYRLLSGSLPCIFIDNEPKAVKTFSRNLRKQIIPSNVIVGRRGSSNNWGSGYRDTERIFDVAMESVRKTAEQCDCFMGSVVFHSTAGGTGSGLTSCLVESLREQYPLQYIMCVCITPFSSGETPLQYYNSLLCLSHLQNYSDCILVLHNDNIMKQTIRQQCSVSIMDMNNTIAKTLLNCFQPVHLNKTTLTIYNEPWELVRSLTPQQSRKFISSSPIISSWNFSNFSYRSRCRTQSLVCVIRGDSKAIQYLMSDTNSIEKKLKSLYNPVEWNPYPIDYWFSNSHRDKQLSVIYNSSDITDYLSQVRDRAMVMYQKKAYLHWYEKYDVNKDMFKAGFDDFDSMIKSYHEL